MVLDAHNRAFAFFGCVPRRMVYDNLKAVVETIFPAINTQKTGPVRLSRLKTGASTDDTDT